MPRSCLNQSSLETLRTTVAANTSAVATASTAATTALGTTTVLTYGTGRTTVYSDDYVSILWDGSGGNYQPFFVLTALWANTEAYVNAGQMLIKDGTSPSSSMHLSSHYIDGAGGGLGYPDLYFSDGGAYDSNLSPTNYGSFGKYWLTPETATSLPSYLIQATYGPATFPEGVLRINVRRL